MDAKLARAIPLQRLGRAEEIAQGVLWLASDESSFMTAAELRLDGGISAAVSGLRVPRHRMGVGGEGGVKAGERSVP